MLLSPRRLPKKFNRRVSSETRTLLRQRHSKHRQYTFERWRRLAARLRRQLETFRKPIMRALAVVAISLIPLSVGIALFSPTFELQSIGVVRSDLRIDIPAVQRALFPLLHKQLLFLSSKEVTGLLTDAIPDLTAVTVQKHYPHAITVRLELDPIIARLEIVSDPSAEVVTDSGATLADYLTKRGMYVRYAPAQIAGSSSLPILRVVDWSARPNVGTQPFDARILDLVPHAEQALRDQFGQTVLSRSIYVRAQEFHLATKEYSLWFDLRTPLEDQLNRYRTFLRTVGIEGAEDYVDLRLADRVVYR